MYVLLPFAICDYMPMLFASAFIDRFSTSETQAYKESLLVIGAVDYDSNSYEAFILT